MPMNCWVLTSIDNEVNCRSSHWSIGFGLEFKPPLVLLCQMINLWTCCRSSFWAKPFEWTIRFWAAITLLRTIEQIDEFLFFFFFLHLWRTKHNFQKPTLLLRSLSLSTMATSPITWFVTLLPLFPLDIS